MTTNTLDEIIGDIWDVRDLIELFESLESELVDVFNNQLEDEQEDEKALDGEDSDFLNWVEDCQLEEAIEYRAIKEVLEELKGSGGDEQWRGDWYPCTMIAEDYFTAYCQDLVSDIGDMPREIPSYIEIDWDATANNIKIDYSSIDIDGTTYYFR
jgi:hypothetical protein